MKQYTVPMALVDYIPVILFLLALIVLVKDLKDKMNKLYLCMFIVGGALVGIAGCLKATYKLLYALNIGDYVWMSNQFFSNQSIGFLLAGIGLVLGVLNLKSNKTYSFLPTMALVGIMVVGLGAMDAGLCYLANKMKKRNALVMFIVSFFLCLMMGYLSSKDFDKVFMNWVAQGVNTLGQLLLYLGVRVLDKAGLKELA